jgi:nitrate reductase gamma subunit
VNGVSAADIFWWVAVPYFALGVFVIGHIWRWRYDQYGWTSRSTQLQERRMLGSPIFHYATSRHAGHVLGILIPARFTEFLGTRPHLPRVRSHRRDDPGHLVIVGVIILAARRLLIPRVRATTSPDWFNPLR